MSALGHLLLRIRSRSTGQELRRGFCLRQNTETAPRNRKLQRGIGFVGLVVKSQFALRRSNVNFRGRCCKPPSAQCRGSATKPNFAHPVCRGLVLFGRP